MSWGDRATLPANLILDLITAVKCLHRISVRIFVVDELAVGLDFLPVMRFSHHFCSHISFVEKPTLY
jgi:hypothetical protein